MASINRTPPPRPPATGGGPRPHGAPTPSFRFEPQDRLRFDGNDYVYHRATDGGHVLRQRNGSLEETFGDREMHRIAHSRGFGHDRAFFAEGNTRARERSGVASMADLPAGERARTSWKHTLCLRFIAMEANGETSRSDAKMKEAIRTIYSDMGACEAKQAKRGRRRSHDNARTVSRRPSPRAVREWLGELEASGMKPTVLRDGRRQSGNRAPRLHPVAYALVAEAARGFATEKRPTVRKCHDDMLGALREANAMRAAEGLEPIPEPSIKATTKAVKRIPAFEACAGRLGLDAARQRFRLVKGSPEATRPGERVEMDEWTINIQTIMTREGAWAGLPPDIQKALTGRWLACGAICVATKCLLGFRLGRTATGSLARSTLRMVVSDKTAIAAAAGARTPWDMALNPDLVVTDGGSALTSNEMVAAIADLGARHDVPTNGMPHLRGTIERVFGTLDAMISPYLTGRTFSDPREKGDYDSAARASIGDADIERILVLAIVDAYHNSPHAGLFGETPRNAWKRLTGEYGLCPPPGPDDRRAIFGTELSRVANMQGIRFLGLPYLDDVLGRRILDRDRFEATIRVDEEDLSCISVMLDGAWHAVPCLAEGFEGVTAAAWLEAMADLRRRFADEGAMSRDVVMDALDAIRAIAAAAERRAGISVEPIGRDRLDRAEQELLGGWSLPLGDAPDGDGSGDPLDGGMPTGSAGPQQPQGDRPPDDDPDDDGFSVEHEGYR